MFTRIAQSYVNFIDGISDRIRWLGWFLLAINFILIYNIILRYFFKSPPIWVWDVTHQFLAFAMVMAGAYTLFHKSHVALDMFSARWSEKTKAFVDLFTAFIPLLFLISLLVVTSQLAKYDVIHRVAAQSLLATPVYPLQVAIALGLLLQLLQYFALMLRNIMIIKGTRLQEKQHAS